jgi:hypothetical protein
VQALPGLKKNLASFETKGLGLGGYGHHTAVIVGEDNDWAVGQVWPEKLFAGTVKAGTIQQGPHLWFYIVFCGRLEAFSHYLDHFVVV